VYIHPVYKRAIGSPLILGLPRRYATSLLGPFPRLVMCYYIILGSTPNTSVVQDEYNTVERSGGTTLDLDIRYAKQFENKARNPQEHSANRYP